MARYFLLSFFCCFFNFIRSHDTMYPIADPTSLLDQWEEKEKSGLSGINDSMLMFTSSLLEIQLLCFKPLFWNAQVIVKYIRPRVYNKQRRVSNSQCNVSGK